jgi:hypothetical protein
MASRSLGTLTLDLIARVGGFEQGMDKAARSAEKNLSAIEKRAQQFGRALGAALKVGAGLAAAGLGAVAVAVQNTINSLDELSKSAQKAGVTTEEFSKLAYAGELADVSVETLTSSLGKLTKAQAEALDESSKTAEVFEALGIAVKDADGNLRSSADVLGDFADKFRDLGGSPEAVAAGFQLFGRSFQELIPLLKDGRDGIQGAGDELERFGGVISTEAGQAAEEFNDNLTRLKSQFSAIFAQVAQQLLPTLVDLSEDLKDLASNGDLARNATTLLTAAIDAGVGALRLYQAAVDNVSIAIEQAVKSYEGWTEITRNFGTAGFADGTVLAGINKIKDAANEASEARERLARLRNAPAAPLPGQDEIDFTLGAPLSADEQAAANQRLQQALAGTEEKTKKATRAKKEQTEAEKAWLDLQETYALIEEQTAQFTTDRIIREGELASQREQNTADLLADLAHENALLGKTAEEQERINALRWAGVDAASADGQAITESLAALQARRGAIEDQISAMDALRDASVGFLNDVKEGQSIWESFKSAIDEVADAIFQIIARNLVEQAFGGAGSSSGGAGGGWVSTVLGALFGGGRANGGPVRPNTLYEVNERGRPEMLSVDGRDYLMMGASAGMVTAAGGFGGGVSQQLHFHYAAPYDARTEEQKNARLGFETRNALRRNGQ